MEMVNTSQLHSICEISWLSTRSLPSVYNKLMKYITSLMCDSIIRPGNCVRMPYLFGGER